MKRIDNVTNLFSAVQLLAPGHYDNEELFREAFDGSVPQLDSSDSRELRSAFYGKLVSILRQSMQEHSEGIPAIPSQLNPIVAQDIVSRVFPAAFLQLKAGERLLLFLSVVERFDADSIAEIIGFEPDHSWRQLESVRNKLDMIIRDLAGPALQHLAPASHIPADWIDANLQSFVRDYLSRPASSMQTFVEASLSPRSFATGAAATPAPARPAEQSSPVRNRRLSLSAISVAAVVIFFTGLAGFVFSKFLEPPIDTPMDLLELSVARSAEQSPVLTTEDLGQAEQFIRSHFNRQLSAPELNGLQLSGVGSTEIISGVRIPSLVYQPDNSTEQMVVFGYTYSLIDQLEVSVDIPEDLLKSVEPTRQPVVREVSGRKIALWRETDDIMVAVLPQSYGGDEILF